MEPPGGNPYARHRDAASQPVEVGLLPRIALPGAEAAAGDGGVAEPDLTAGMGDPVLISTFGRSGTHLVIDLIRRNFPAFRSWKWPMERNEHLYAELGLAARGSEPVARTRRRLRRAARPLLKTHEWHAIRQDPVLCRSAIVRALIARGQVIEVVREPLRAIASWHELEVAEARRLGRPVALPIDAFIDLRAADWAEHVRSVLEAPPQLLLRFEDVRSDPAGALARIAAATGATARPCDPLLPETYGSLFAARLARAFGVRPQSTAIVVRGDIRRACRFDWTPERRARVFRQVRDEMAALGYTAD